jgi:hypothetical protein
MKSHRFTFAGIFHTIIIVLISLYILAASGFRTFKDDTTLKRFRIPTVVGNTDTTTLCLSPAYMLNAWYHIERLDTILDTLDLTKPPRDQEGLYYQFNMPEEIRTLPRSNVGIQLIADTINELSMTKQPIWASYLFHRFYSKNVKILQDDTLIQKVKSFPIYVANMSPSYFASLDSQDGSMMLVVEAIDRKGEWMPIEYWSGSWCGNSYYTMMIPPMHMMMTRGIKCSGDFRTKCRLKLDNENGPVFSNEFYMAINETQFSMPIEKER